MTPLLRRINGHLYMWLDDRGWLPTIAGGAEGDGGEGGATATTEPPAPGESPPEGTGDAPSSPEPPVPYNAMDWRNLPDLTRLKDETDIGKVLEVYPDMSNFVRDAVGWRSEMSRRVRLPNGENAAPEDWQRFWQQLPGYPKSPQGYQESVTLPELGQDEAGQPTEWDPALLSTFYDTAHAQGLTAPQAQAVLETYARTLSESTNVMEAQAAQAQVDAERDLQTRFGASLQRKLGAARNYFMRSIGNTELGQTVWDKVQAYVNPETGVALGNDPDFIEFYSMQYERFGEPVDLLQDQVFTGVPTRDEIAAEKTKALDIYNDTKKSAAERQAAWQRAEALNTQEQELARSTRR